MSQSTTHIFTFHGFLGSPGDFEFLSPLRDQQTGDESSLKKHDFNLADLSGISLENLGQEVVNRIQNILSSEQVLSKSDSKGRVIGIGYSLGGRVLLHALEAAPHLFNDVILISSHTGITEIDLVQRKRRINEDLLWAERFNTLPWKDLMTLWNRREIFGGHSEAYEEVSPRSFYAHCLTAWSLGVQKDFAYNLAKYSANILFIAGKHDRRYVELYQKLASEHPKIQLQIVEGCGHRVIFQRADEVKALVERMLRTPGQKS